MNELDAQIAYRSHRVKSNCPKLCFVSTQTYARRIQIRIQLRFSTPRIENETRKNTLFLSSREDNASRETSSPILPTRDSRLTVLHSRSSLALTRLLRFFKANSLARDVLHFKTVRVIAPKQPPERLYRRIFLIRINYVIL